MTDNLTFRPALRADVPQIVALLTDDPLGAKREQYEEPLPQEYCSAFDALSDSPDNHLVVACKNDAIAGVFQLTFIQYLTYKGGVRAQIEGVRVSKKFRGHGIGKAMVEWAIARAKEFGCHVVQLTTDKSRPDAIRFYESLGFKVTHEGMKLHL